VTINIANADFSFLTAPPAASVIAGQSTQFLLTVTPAGGLANNVTFSCSPVAGIICTFNPAMVAPTNGAATTTLTVTTSATVSRYGFLVLGLAGPGAFLAALAFLSLVLWRGEYLRNAGSLRLATPAAAVMVMLGLAIGGCGGYSSSTQPNRGTASIVVTAQSGNISHTTRIRVTVQ
jgi:hypothetical protein